MVVALGALEARSQENLRGSPGARQRVAVGPVVVRRRARVGAASRRDKFAGELVERFVFHDALANPVVEILNSFLIERVGLGPQQIRPFQRPEIRKLRPFQQPIDEARPLFRPPFFELPAHVLLPPGGQRVLGSARRAAIASPGRRGACFFEPIFRPGGRIVHERARLFHCGQNAEQIEIRPAHEHVVRAKVRRIHAQRSQSGEHLPVNVVMCRGLLPHEAGSRGHEGQPDWFLALEVAHQDRGYSLALRLHQAVVRHFDGTVRRLVNSQ